MSQQRRMTRRNKKQAGHTATPRYQRTIELLPRTEKQAQYIDALTGHDMVVATGPAGTGKTYVALTYAAKLYQRGQIQKIVLTRPTVACGKGLGFFPGELADKMAPWVSPAMDVLKQHLGKVQVETMVRDGDLVVEPFEVMRGKTFDNSFILLDEAQNTTHDQMHMFLTRIGEGSVCVVDGDAKQSDLTESSGLHTVLTIIRRRAVRFPHVEFDVDDCVRSGVCRAWIEAFDTYDTAANYGN